MYLPATKPAALRVLGAGAFVVANSCHAGVQRPAEQ
jgi:hypothetical protein